jgi:hypothetical protein
MPTHSRTDPVYRIALIGAGQLGSRHLQGLVRLALQCEIDVVDPSPASLALARQRFSEMPQNPAIRAVRFHNALQALPASLDYVVVATAADVRLAVLQSLLADRQVRFMLLEKVLFQRLDDYYVAQALLASGKVQAWVNCTRRLFPIYGEVQSFFAGEQLRYFQVMGGAWGLGCNSVHFVDLLGLLTGRTPTAISTDGLDPGLIPSKRSNFMEFTGVLRGRMDDVFFELASLADSSARMLMTLRSESRTCVLDETGGRAFFLDTGRQASWDSREFVIPFLSQLSTSIAERILIEGACDLATFDESKAYHLPLLDALGDHAARALGTPAGFCPVT